MCASKMKVTTVCDTIKAIEASAESPALLKIGEQGMSMVKAMNSC